MFAHVGSAGEKQKEHCTTAKPSAQFQRRNRSPWPGKKKLGSRFLRTLSCSQGSAVKKLLWRGSGRRRIRRPRATWIRAGCRASAGAATVAALAFTFAALAAAAL